MKHFTTSQPQSKNRVTQIFWARPEYYKKYWFLWHEGLDINDTPWSPSPVYAVEDWTIVVKPNAWAYGLRIDLYMDNLDVIFWYCHLSEVKVKTKDIVKSWDIIWYTGKTWTQDIHLHIMATEIDDNLIPINIRNWYAGAVEVWIEKWNFYYMRSKELDDYKWIQVEYSDSMCSDGSNWCVFEWFEKIFLTENHFAKKDDIKRLWTLEHEYGHIIFNRATKEEREAFKVLFDASEEKDFITEYSKKDYKEDFAEIGKILFLRKWSKVNQSALLDLKCLYFKEIYNKYSRA